MGRRAGWMEELAGSAPMKSLGHPMLRRELERLFWQGIAGGLTSADAAVAVGVSSAAGGRWFRKRGGMPTFMLDPVSGRYRQAATPGSQVGNGVEPRADLCPIEGRFPDDESMRISHEAIYQALYVQGRGALRRELTACLRSGRALRVPRARVRGRGKSFITEQIVISERSPEADDRAVPGHWEGDLILGAPHRDRDAGGAHHAVYDAASPTTDARSWQPKNQARSAACRSRRRSSPRRDHKADHDTARAATPIAHLGPGSRDVTTRRAEDRYRTSHLFL
jgi:hypothetical protein